MQLTKNDALFLSLNAKVFLYLYENNIQFNMSPYLNFNFSNLTLPNVLYKLITI